MSCGTRAIFLLLCGTRNSTLFMCCSAAIAALSVVSGTRSTTYSCVVAVLAPRGCHAYLVLLAVLAPLLTHVLLRYSQHGVVMHYNATPLTPFAAHRFVRRRTYRCFDALVGGSVPPDGRILTPVSRLYASSRRRSGEFGTHTGRLCAWGRSHLYL